MKRKEVYATTGTRMTVRLFAGWEFDEADVHRADFARHGYTKGVPMGGDLSKAPEVKHPPSWSALFAIPDGANLDRVQIIKGWLDGDARPTSRSTTSPSPVTGPSVRTGAARKRSAAR